LKKILKKNNYWNGAEVQEAGKFKEPDLSSVIGDILLRTYKLEDIVKNNLQEIFSVKEKIFQLDGYMSKSGNGLKDIKIDELYERICRLESMFF